MSSEVAIDDDRCRLLVELPAAVDRPLRETLRRLTERDRLGGIVVGRSTADVRDIASSLSVALLSRDMADADIADGLMQPFATAGRATSAAELIRIAEVGTSRHAAMEAGENGADVVLFAATDGDAPDVALDCVRWWRQLFVLPVAVAAEPTSATELAGAGADFLLIAGQTIGSAEVADRILAELDRTVPEPPLLTG
ncbi:MAG: hypothetical protein AAFX81_06180 [Pseudomonadota bacterium]